MERIGVRELRQHASKYLERVRAGETVEVTDRGRLVDLLIPPHPHPTARDRLLFEGRLVPATAAPRVPLRRLVTCTSTEDVLDDLRAER